MPEQAAAPFHGAIVPQVDKAFRDKVGFTETAFWIDFDFLNCKGSSKVMLEAGMVAKP
ncbi:hypothetical protein RsS62_15350 [Rhizobium dioscoreae]|uniref:Uncharacterized protein n=1 Tax=Rhizobium dioscoreae TaxID=2653122 RepID=A0ABQ0Z2T4_9HYPH|nr:hypothetical protein RsS62_15350 [Rhizobium dioscoreae]GES49603.1 hypothetical protein RsS93_22170 [Rhizobium dioscoreae]GLU81044.1 hypothetical protein Rhsp01_22200 [Rhizobium sp. NBRC 114257]